MVALLESRQSTKDAGLPLVYFNHGYEAGYRQAVRDLLSDLTALSEEFMSTRPEAREELDRVVYPFEDYLQKRLERLTPDGHFVEG